MKRLLFVTTAALAIVFILSPTSVYAQGLSVGMKAGLNLATLYGNDVDVLSNVDILPDAFSESIDKKMKTGTSFGVFVTYDINDIFTIQPEFLFTMKGMKTEAQYEGFLGETINVKETIILNYLEFPILVKVSILTGGSVKPNILFGPALAIKSSARRKYEITGLSEEFKQIYEDFGIYTSEEVNIDVKSSDIGLVFGAGLDLRLGSGKAIIDARYTLGLINILTEIRMLRGDFFLPNYIIVEDPDIKNSVISIMIGYSFPL